MPIVTDGLIGYWHYQQGVSGSTWENIAPDTKGQYNGQINGAILQSDGMYFDGVDDLVSIPDLSLVGNGLIGYTYEILFMQQGKSGWQGLMGNGIPNSIRVETGNINAVGFGANSKIFLSPNNSISRDNIALATLSYGYPFNSRITGLVNGNIASDLNTTSNHNINGFFIGSIDDGSYSKFRGLILCARIYNRFLTQEEVLQNYAVGTAIGLEDEPPTQEPPKPTIITINAPTPDNTISDEPNMDRATVTFTFDQDVTEWKVNVLGSSHDTGTIADSGGAVAAGTEITAEIDYTELYQEGQNRINIYGKNPDGLWTPYSV